MYVFCCCKCPTASTYLIYHFIFVAYLGMIPSLHHSQLYPTFGFDHFDRSSLNGQAGFKAMETVSGSRPQFVMPQNFVTQFLQAQVILFCCMFFRSLFFDKYFHDFEDTRYDANLNGTSKCIALLRPNYGSEY